MYIKRLKFSSSVNSCSCSWFYLFMAGGLYCFQKPDTKYLRFITGGWWRFTCLSLDSHVHYNYTESWFYDIPIYIDTFKEDVMFNFYFSACLEPVHYFTIPHLRHPRWNNTNTLHRENGFSEFEVRMFQLQFEKTPWPYGFIFRTQLKIHLPVSVGAKVSSIVLKWTTFWHKARRENLLF